MGDVKPKKSPEEDQTEGPPVNPVTVVAARRETHFDARRNRYNRDRLFRAAGVMVAGTRVALMSPRKIVRRDAAALMRGNSDWRQRTSDQSASGDPAALGAYSLISQRLD
jgi:hypothetical protein